MDEKVFPIHQDASLTDEERERRQKMAEAASPAPRSNPTRLDDLRNHAAGLVYTTEKVLEEYGTLLEQRGMKLGPLHGALRELKGAIPGEDEQALTRALNGVEDLAWEIPTLLPDDPGPKSATMRMPRPT